MMNLVATAVGAFLAGTQLLHAAEYDDPAIAICAFAIEEGIKSQNPPPQIKTSRIGAKIEGLTVILTYQTQVLTIAPRRNSKLGVYPIRPDETSMRAE